MVTIGELKELYMYNPIEYAREFLLDPHTLMESEENEMEIETMAILRSYMNCNINSVRQIAYQDYLMDDLEEEQVDDLLMFIQDFQSHYYTVRNSKCEIYKGATKAFLQRCVTELDDRAILQNFGDNITNVQTFRVMLMHKPEAIYTSDVIISDLPLSSENYAL